MFSSVLRRQQAAHHPRLERRLGILWLPLHGTSLALQAKLSRSSWAADKVWAICFWQCTQVVDRVWQSWQPASSNFIKLLELWQHFANIWPTFAKIYRIWKYVILSQIKNPFATELMKSLQMRAKSDAPRMQSHDLHNKTLWMHRPVIIFVFCKWWQHLFKHSLF